MPMSTQLSTVLESIDLLSSEDRRVVEVHLAMLRLSPERQARLLELGLDLGALTDDLGAYVQGATDMLPGSLEDVLCAASHVSAYVEMDESDRGDDYGASEARSRRASPARLRGPSAGERLAEVAIIPGALPQGQVDSFATALHALISGSEGRVADAEEHAGNLRRALDSIGREVAGLRAQLAHFEDGRSGRGDMFAIEAHNGVWLCGKPDPSAWGLHFSSWADMARAFPGLRPAGIKDGHIVMRPIGSMEPASSTAQ